MHEAGPAIIRDRHGLCICYSKCISWHFSLAGYRIDYCVASPTCAPPLSLPSNPARVPFPFACEPPCYRLHLHEPANFFFLINDRDYRCIYFMHVAYYCLHGACECATVFLSTCACQCPIFTRMAQVIRIRVYYKSISDLLFAVDMNYHY